MHRSADRCQPCNETARQTMQAFLVVSSYHLPRYVQTFCSNCVKQRVTSGKTSLCTLIPTSQPLAARWATNSAVEARSYSLNAQSSSGSITAEVLVSRKVRIVRRLAQTNE